MTRYLQIGTEIAQRVRSGELPSGTELPTVREYARTQRTSTSTIGRAYRYLADAAVITLVERRQARVATDGVIAAARLLEADRVFRLAGSDDPALQILLNHVGPTVVPIGTRGSFHGLRALARDTADGVAIYLRHHNGTSAREVRMGRSAGCGVGLVAVWLGEDRCSLWARRQQFGHCDELVSAGP